MSAPADIGNTEFEVVIAGFGPAGATLACLLGAQGIRTLVVDRLTGVYDKPRAFAMDHEIMRVFQNLGLAAAIAPHVAPFTASEHYGVDGQLNRRLTMIEPPYPLGWIPSMVFRQPPLEAALGIANAAWETLMGGFTTVQTVGDSSERPLRDAVRDHGFPGPRVLTSLAWIEGKGDSTGSPEDLRDLVRIRKTQGADLVKIFASNSQRVGAKPTLSEAQLAILCAEAKAVGLRAMVHAYRGQVSAAARAGCWQVEHATYATRADIEIAVQAGTFISPQVGLVVQNYLENKARYLGVGNYTEEGMATMGRDLPLDFEVCRFAVSTPGAKVVFSTDATAGAHGRNAEEFLGRVQHCGQTTMAALVSANSLAAAALGMSDSIGALAAGYEADIIALDGNPLTDLTAVRRVVFVMRGGVVYKWAGSRPVRR